MHEDEEKIRNARLKKQAELKALLDKMIENGIINLELSDVELLKILSNLITENGHERKSVVRMLINITHPDTPNGPIYEKIFKVINSFRNVLESEPPEATKKTANDTRSRTQGKTDDNYSPNNDRSTQDYGPRQEELDEEYREKYSGKGYKFFRSDLSSFSLIYLAPVLSEESKNVLYEYLYIDEMDKQRKMFTEMSPGELFENAKNKIDFFTKVFLGKERVKHIFSKVDYNTFVEWPTIVGNGYAGNFDLYNNISSDFNNWNMVFGIRKNEFLEILQKETGVAFYREDGTKFNLQYLGEVKFKIELADKLYRYCYYYHKGEKRDLYTEMSPGQIFKTIMNKQALDFFVNRFLGLQNTYPIFNNEPFGNIDNLHCFGYGYAGQMITMGQRDFEILGQRRPFECIHDLYNKEQNTEGGRN